MGDKELGPAGPHAPRLGATLGLNMLEQGALGRLLMGEGLLGSFLLLTRAPGAVGRVGGPRTLVPGRRLGAEVAEAPRGLHHPRLEEGEVARAMGQASPLRC